MFLRRIHVPACSDFVEHVFHAVEELGDIEIEALTFVDQVTRDWAEERQLADAGDPALIEYHAQAEAEIVLGIDHWTVS
jgi:hypothetical protein